MSTWISRGNHRRMNRRLTAFYAGELAEAQQEVVQRHLKQCPTCRAALQRLAEADRALRTSRPETPVLTSERTDALFRRALAASQVRPRRASGRTAPALILAAAGLGIVVWLVHLSHPFPLQGPGAAAPSDVDRGNGKVTAAGPRPGPQKAILPVPGQSSNRSRVENVVREPDRIASRPLQPRHFRLTHVSTIRKHPLVLSSQYTAFSLSEFDSYGLEDLAPGGQDPPGQPSSSHLIVVVTGASAPRLNVTVSTGPQTQPGFTRVAALDADGQGNGAWTQCTIRDDLQEETISTTEYTFLSGRPVAYLTLETTETVSKEKGNRP
jgi:hypothetical protein